MTPALEPLPDAPEPNRVLLIKPSALGDVVTGLPVLRGLRRSFPNAHISWLISERCAPLVRTDSDLDEIILFERRKLARAWRSVSGGRAMGRLLWSLRSEKFDWAIDLQGLLRSGLLSAATRAPLRAGFADAREGADIFYTHRVFPTAVHTVDRNIELARYLGIDARGEDMRLEIPVSGVDFVEAFSYMHGVRSGGFLVCAPTTTWATKLYPVRYWRKVISELSRLVPIVLIAADTPPERELSREIARGLEGAVIDLSAQTKVEEMVGLIAASRGVICCDSAAKFIAAAVGVDCITLIGPTRVERTGPYLRGRSIVADVPCQGCVKRACKHITCMQSISPAVVVTAAEEMLDGRSSI